VLYVASNAPMAVWLEELNPRSRSLASLYRAGVPRAQIYAEMVEEILAPVRRGLRVCAAFYGHPGIVVTPSHEAIARARAEGFQARMLPGISAEDCLIADLGVDPIHGLQSYDATALLLRRHVLDPTVALVLWQVDAAGKLDATPEPNPAALRELTDFLLGLYPPEHEVVFYGASVYSAAKPIIERRPLDEVASLDAAPAPTLFVPPLKPRPFDDDVARRLGLSPT
jgi:uncharacterized protein YabN with tetrapyrrole methylase and pyrophosphatase domain